ncbi:hypothetical protein [Deinococcus daejeonensis]|uniref:Uncharacterized protein n=1 Tax=Deinococcus daejeonensis TaxID=1007098 RepID=A0ABQ2IYX2_9DEIO|nr:hypothetical protein [Deinococcus daejeonensis]GGN32247.1 hypothetical protein GCM10010842_08760 [Deinococcus daejeonensis]
MGFIRYLRDLPERDYHFGKLGPDGWQQLAKAQPGEPDPMQALARRRFFAPYNLPEFQTHIPRRACIEYVQALQAGTVPNWVMALTPDHLDIKEKAGDMK